MGPTEESGMALLVRSSRAPARLRAAGFCALLLFALLSHRPATAKPRFTKTMSCPEFCSAAWECLSPTLQKRLKGRAAYQKSCLATCPAMRQNPSIFAESLTLMEQRCLERDAEREKERLKRDAEREKERLKREAETPKPTPSPSPKPSPAPKPSPSSSPKPSPSPNPTRSPRPVDAPRPQPSVLPQPPPAPRLACRRLCDRAASCLSGSGDRVAFVARCQLGCYAATTATEQERVRRQLAALCRRAPSPTPGPAPKPVSCAELCLRGWRCLPKRSQLLFDNPNAYLAICQPDCERVKSDPKALRHKIRQLTHGCADLDDPPTRRPSRERPLPKASCPALCMKSYRCLSAKKRRAETQVAYVSRCLTTCEEMHKDQRRFSAVVRSVELMCKRNRR